jgi:hypothetical protein
MKAHARFDLDSPSDVVLHGSQKRRSHGPIDYPVVPRSTGFTIDTVSRSKNRITFSDMVGQVESAFATELHYYSVNGNKEFAPSADLSVPAALASLVQTVSNLSTFRPLPRTP